MPDIRIYLLSVVASAIICAIAVNIIPKNSAQALIIKLLAGVFLAITVISPWTKMQLFELETYVDSVQAEADRIAIQGELESQQEISASISEHVQTYILDKASLLGATPDVTVVMSSAAPTEINSVIITGNLSPYAKTRLTQVICTDLGLTEEMLSWQ